MLLELVPSSDPPSSPGGGGGGGDGDGGGAVSAGPSVFSVSTTVQSVYPGAVSLRHFTPRLILT